MTTLEFVKWAQANHDKFKKEDGYYIPLTNNIPPEILENFKSLNENLKRMDMEQKFKNKF